jgi:hypothetical protein
MCLGAFVGLYYLAVRTRPENETSIVRYLPTNVTNVVNHGNNWHTFEWNGRLFLYHRERAGYHLGESITELAQ